MHHWPKFGKNVSNTLIYCVNNVSGCTHGGIWHSHTTLGRRYKSDKNSWTEMDIKCWQTVRLTVAETWCGCWSQDIHRTGEAMPATDNKSDDTYPSMISELYSADLSHTGHSHVGFFSFICRYVAASKHCRWWHKVDRHGTDIRTLLSCNKQATRCSCRHYTFCNLKLFILLDVI